jgi:hypothetical protein
MKLSSKSGILLPFVAGALAVDAMQSAEAADGSQVSPSAGGQAATFAAGAGLYEGGRRLLQAIPAVVGVAHWKRSQMIIQCCLIFS